MPLPRLGEELRIRPGNGTFGKWLIQSAKTDVLLLDDWGMAGIDAQTRADLLEIIEDRAANKATIITSQLPIEHWHAWVRDATIADAILDRVVQKSPLHPDGRVPSSEAKIHEEGGQSITTVNDTSTISMRNIARCAAGHDRPESAFTITRIRSGHLRSELMRVLRV